MTSAPPRGCFITIEGGEGAGKSTQAARLAEQLRNHGLEVVTTREPGGTPEAEALRGLLLDANGLEWDATEEVMLMFAARHAHLRGLIKPALERGAWVICDRFTDSTRAYQGYGHGGDHVSIEALARIVQQGLQPDRTFLLDLDVETGIARASARKGPANRYDTADIEFHERVRAGFHQIAKADPARVKIINSAQAEEAVAEALLDAIGDLLPL